jgi:hypothetical protein
MSHGTCSYICMCINAVANSVMLYLQHDFHNIIFKIKHELCIISGSATPPPPQGKVLGARLQAPGFGTESNTNIDVFCDVKLC